MDTLVGKTIECHKMSLDSFYVAVKGTVEKVDNGFATVRATQVIDRWSILWEDHPSSCLTSCRVENLEIV